ncbi:LytTr DNA-binding domain protein [Oribacterium sp. oral taxon 078 str. F0263]|uniref:LytTR family DNA-binding domain-containing protein n=1 Tax=Oribacterium sp. oral taxon 078 TaxID=652706 RepID=UPI0001CDEDE5|nr:LytTR family DNA-binding domain-containing protein [Oribacterium sp. oral taxon 078]EFE91750.1 LytTr DNA-binding domain protein [Oribacterium sp. oral taxon 078 str. F0262]ERL04736.1 LytTr DNA-binding domain protein [Oribacterium sp. oral taxon 078 str. F0263]
MRLILRERQDLEHPEVIIEYRELTDGVKRVSAFVRSVDQSISCKREGEEFSIPLSDVFYIESVDKKTFVYGETEVYQTGLRLTELEKMLSHAGFVRVSKSVILNIEKLQGVKNLANSRLEAFLSNNERICVSRKYLKEIRAVLLRRNA